MFFPCEYFCDYFHPNSFRRIYPWINTPPLFPNFTAGSTQSPMVVTRTQLFLFLAHLAPNSVPVVSWFNLAFIVTYIGIGDIFRDAA